MQFAKHTLTCQRFEALSWFELTMGENTRLDQWLTKVKEYQLD